MSRRLCGLLLGLAGFAASGTLAHAEDWQVCNETSFVLRIATAVDEGVAQRVRGWAEVLPGDCADYTITDGSQRYVYAESHPAHAGGIREWKGEDALCAGDADFEAAPETTCALQNLETRDFLRVPTDEERTLLVEPDDFGARARVAGLQRLLSDAGYKIRRIDGRTGRGTSRRLAEFREDAGLSSGAGEAEQYAALLELAEARRSELGLTLCNRSGETVWGAIAFQREGTWHSRGWWPVEVEACDQLFAEPLDAHDLHVFALQEDTRPPDIDPDDPEPAEVPERPDRRLRAAVDSLSQFCISEARFSAVGREDCRDRGYVAVNFRPVTARDGAAGTTLTLTDADFAGRSATGLRR